MVDLHHVYRFVFKSSVFKVEFFWRLLLHRPCGYSATNRRKAPGIFHCVTQAVKQMMARKGYTLLALYLYEFFMVEKTKGACLEACNTICKLHVDLGFHLNHTKLVAAIQNLVFQCVEIDTLELSLSLLHSKLTDLKALNSSFWSCARGAKKIFSS